jgi:hypothetical protein
MARRAARRDDQHVGNGRFAANIKGDDFLGLIVLKRGDNEARRMFGVEAAYGAGGIIVSLSAVQVGGQSVLPSMINRASIAALGKARYWRRPARIALEECA